VIVVDSSGWLEYFAGTVNRFNYREAILDTENLLVPVITLYEVYRKINHQSGSDKASQAIMAMQQGQIIELTAELTLFAAQLSSEHRLPLADSLIYATAQAYEAELYTQDAHFEGLLGVKYFSKV
jgi:toxin FitB